MTDHTAGSTSHGHARRRGSRVEFYVYFTLIFLLATPVAVTMWLVSLVIDRRLPPQGPFARAWREAGMITPEIFRH